MSAELQKKAWKPVERHMKETGHIPGCDHCWSGYAQHTASCECGWFSWMSEDHEHA